MTENIRYKVLLIEDDKIDQMVFKRLVDDENLPYDYTVASSVSQAQSILLSGRFDVVIVDYLLGDGTAFDLLDSVRDTPVIFATGVGNEGLAVKAMKAGASDYLIKDPARNYLKALPVTVENAVRHKTAELELKKYHDNLEALVKERTEQLAAEKELLAVTLSCMADAVIVVDAEKRIMLLNKVGENLVGWKFRQVQGKLVDKIFRLVNEQTREIAESPIDKVLGSGEVEAGTERDALIARDGSECPISATAAPIRKNDGTMVGIVMVFRDVSRQREIEHMKTDFVASVSHELRTPLTSIKAFTATILRDPDMTNHIIRKFLTIIDEESNRLAKLVEDILEISQLESGAVRITREPVNIAVVIKQALLPLGPLANKKNIQLKTDIGDGLGQLHGDGSKIQSMLTNLVDNGIKFTPQRGQVSVLVRRHGEELIIRVSDTGVGIPKEALPEIFNRFYRVYRPGKQIHGTGLGLAIVKKIVMMHGGRIEVESRVDQGTTFTVLLPLPNETGGTGERLQKTFQKQRLTVVDST